MAVEWIATISFTERKTLGRLFVFGGKSIGHAFTEFEAFGVCAKLNDFSNLLVCIAIHLYDHTTENDETEAMHRAVALPRANIA